MKTQLIMALLLAAGTTMAQRQENNNNRQPPTAAELISRLDKDKDGKVSESEFDGPAEHFSQFDTNGDGYLSESEIPSGPPPVEQNGSQPQQRGRNQQPDRSQQQGRPGERDQNGGFVTRLDKDGDGRISQSEFDGPDDAFTELDKNNDNYLSEDEAPSGPPPRGRR
ncbi:hypothetical protein P4B35_15140 [Pontiellaceae bacterium B12227]|nr:hypothetical protein [Pontiellaceae bacterium B12227]